MNWSITPAIDHPLFFAAMEEKELEDKVMGCVRDIHVTYGEELTAYQMEIMFDAHGIYYQTLPKYLQAEFDYFEIVE